MIIIKRKRIKKWVKINKKSYPTIIKIKHVDYSFAFASNSAIAFI